MSLISICKQLYISYDTNILYTLSTLIRNYFKKIVSDIPDENMNGNYILIRLLKNHFKNTKPIAYLISGPNTLTVHRSIKYNKTIYIFGESHGHTDNCDEQKLLCELEMVYSYPDKKCINVNSNEGKYIEKHGNHIVDIDEYLTKLLQTTDVFIDFYLETPRIRKGDKYKQRYAKGNEYLNKLRSVFNKNIHYDNRVPDIFRSHFIDLRFSYTRTLDFSSDLLFMFMYTYELFELTSDRLNRIHTIYKNISKMSYNKYIEFVITNFTDETKKEVDRSSIGTEIYNFFIAKIKKYISIDIYNKIKRFEVDVNTTDIKITKELETFLHMFYIYQIDLTLYITDCYTLCRIFKKFKTIGYEPQEPTNIITYTGDDHCNILREFLGVLDFREIERATKLKERCLDMSTIKQPFFKKY